MTIDKAGPWDAALSTRWNNGIRSGAERLIKWRAIRGWGCWIVRPWSLSAWPSMQRAQISTLTEHGGTSDGLSTLAQHAASC